MSHCRWHRGVRAYSILLITNAIGCVSLQLFVTHFTKDLDDNVLSVIGMIVFAIGNLLMGFVLNLPILVLAMIMIVLVETSILPLNDALLARMAPPNRIGTYYGVIGLATLGLGVGPIIGGYVYQYYGASTIFSICAVLCFLMIFLYRKIHSKMRQQKSVSVAGITVKVDDVPVI